MDRSLEEDSIFQGITLRHLRIGVWSRKCVRAMTVPDPPAGLPPVDGLLSLKTLDCAGICFDFDRKAVSWQ